MADNRAQSMTPSAYVSNLGAEPYVEHSFIPKTAPKWVLFLAAGMVLCAGSFDSIASKWMNRQVVPTCDGCAAVGFNAPFFQTFLMYCGETLCLIVYLVDELFTSRKGKQRTFDFPTSAESVNKPPSPLWIWSLPMVMDFIGSTMINYALLITFASTVQMLRNFNIIITAGLTIGWFRRPLLVRHWAGVVVVTIGMVITGVYGIVNPEEGTAYDDSLAWLGIVLAIAGTCLNACQYVFEEIILRKYYVSPLKAVGLEGFSGLILTSLALVVCQYADLEDVKGSFYQMGHDSTLIIASVCYIFSITLFNSGGLMVTKLGSGLMRAIIVAARTVTIWILELCLGWNTFDWLNFSGLIVITIGCMVYNRVYPTRCCPSCGAVFDKPVPCCGWVNMPESESDEHKDGYDVECDIEGVDESDMFLKAEKEPTTPITISTSNAVIEVSASSPVARSGE